MESPHDRFNGLRFGGFAGDSSQEGSAICSQPTLPFDNSFVLGSQELYEDNASSFLDDFNESSWSSMDTAHEMACGLRSQLHRLIEVPEDFKKDPENAQKLVDSLNSVFTIINKLVHRKTECEKETRELQMQLSQALQNNRELKESNSRYLADAENQEELWKREVEHLKGTIKDLEKEKHVLSEQIEELSENLNRELSVSKQMKDRIEMISAKRMIHRRINRIPALQPATPLAPSLYSESSHGSSTAETVEDILGSSNDSPSSGNDLSPVHKASDEAADPKSIFTPTIANNIPSDNKQSICSSTPRHGKQRDLPPDFSRMPEDDSFMSTGQPSPVKSPMDDMTYNSNKEFTVISEVPQRLGHTETQEQLDLSLSILETSKVPLVLSDQSTSTDDLDLSDPIFIPSFPETLHNENTPIKVTSKPPIHSISPSTVSFSSIFRLVLFLLLLFAATVSLICVHLSSTDFTYFSVEHMLESLFKPYQFQALPDTI